MKKLLLCIALIGVLCQPLWAQGLSSADVVASFKYRVHSDAVIFPDSVVYKLVNFGTEMVCLYGLTYPKVDTILLATSTERYALDNIAIWAYRVGPLGPAQASWKHVDLGDFGKAGMKESTVPAFWDFTAELTTDADFVSTANETSWVYVYPFPTSDENGDTVLVHYFAWTDSINSNITNTYHNAVLECALMAGYIRMGRSDMAVNSWNRAAMEMSRLRKNRLIQYDIEIVPRTLGGR